VGETVETLLRENVCLYASFDAGLAADVSRGDPEPTINDKLVRHDAEGGRFGGRLVVDARDNAWAEEEFLYGAGDNFPYRPPGGSAGFDGTIAMWLQGDPDADLHDEFPVDPFHVSRHAADASFYLDLTKPNGMFMARDFVIRDGDTLYVTEAPFTQWSKVISSITGSASSVNNLSSLASSN